MNCRKTFIGFCVLLISDFTFSADASETKAPRPSSSSQVSIEQAKKIFDLGFRAQETNDPALAEKFYRRIASTNVGAMSNLGIVLSDQGKLDEAEACCRKAIAMDDPKKASTMAMQHLAFLLASQGKFAEAENWYLKIKKEALSNPIFDLGVTLFNLAKNRELQGDHEKAIVLYRESIEKNCTKSKSSLAILLAEKGGQENLREAEELLHLLIKNGDTSQWLNFGNVLSMQGADHFEKAKDAFLTAIAHKNYQARLSLARLLASAGDNNGAIYQYSEAIYTNGINHPQAISNLANLLAERNQGNDLERAESMLRKAIIVGDIDAMHYLAWLLQKKNDLKSSQEAETILRSALVIEPNSLVTSNQLGLLLKRKDDQKSLQEAKNLFVNVAKAGIAEGYFNLAACLLKMGDKAGAIAELRRAADGGIHLALLHMAELLPPTNIKEKTDLYKKALELGVKDADAYYFLWLHSLITDPFYLSSFDDFNDFLKENDTNDALVVEEKASEEMPRAAEEAGDTGTSKRLAKMYARAQKARAKPVELPLSQSAPKTYKNLKVTSHPDAWAEITPHISKFKMICSALINGESRARLEPLAQYGQNIYSQRLGKKDRLVFRILRGDLINGIESIYVLAANGHYESLKTRVSGKKSTVEFSWSEEKND